VIAVKVIITTELHYYAVCDNCGLNVKVTLRRFVYLNIEELILYSMDVDIMALC